MRYLSAKCTSAPASGCRRVERGPFEHHPGHGGAREWHHHRGGEHALPVLWHVEDHVRLAHRGHGPLQH